MRSTPLLMLLAALLGASVVVLPAVASSETTGTIETMDTKGFYGEQEHHWSPVKSEVAAGNSLTFKNASTEVAHGVEWKTGPATPSCTSGVPVGSSPVASGKNWSGTCTFTTPGVYTFWCTVHESKMSGSITVNANGTTTTTTTAPTGTMTYMQPTGTSTNPSPSGVQAGSPLAGSASSALKLSPNQHGAAIRGSVNISPAGEGGRLEVDALAKSAALASSGKGGRVRVGKLVLSHLQSGKTKFSVPLNGRARKALHRHGRLALSVRIIVSPLSGSPLTITRTVLVRA